MKTRKKWNVRLLAISLVMALSGCAHVGFGFSVPIGPFGSLGVNVGSDGRIGGSVGVGYGPASVQIGSSVQLQPTKTPEAEKKVEPNQ